MQPITRCINKTSWNYRLENSWVISLKKLSIKIILKPKASQLDNFTSALKVNYKPPLAMLNLMPKSASGPPGLCDAVSIMPPSVLYLRITQDTAGVDITPFSATITLATCHKQPAIISNVCTRNVWTSVMIQQRTLTKYLKALISLDWCKMLVGANFCKQPLLQWQNS